MLSEPQHPQSQTPIAILLLAAAILLYIPWLLAIVAVPTWSERPGGSSGEDRIGEGFANFFTMLFGIPLWLALGGLVLLAWRKGLVPVAWASEPGILYALSLIATLIACRVYFAWPGGWSILVPALLPPLLALYAIGTVAPPLASGSMRLLPAVALGGAALVAFAAIPFAAIDPPGYPARFAQHMRDASELSDRVAAKHQQEALQWEANISKLGPDSPLEAWLEYVNGSGRSGQLYEQALEGARRANRRQADAIAMLDYGGINRLAELWQLDLAATPALCAAYDRALARLAGTENEIGAVLGKQLERQLPNIKFLIAAGCNLSSGVVAVEARAGKIVSQYPGDERWTQLHVTVSGLRRGH